MKLRLVQVSAAEVQVCFLWEGVQSVKQASKQLSWDNQYNLIHNTSEQNFEAHNYSNNLPKA